MGIDGDMQMRPVVAAVPLRLAPERSFGLEEDTPESSGIAADQSLERLVLIWRRILISRSLSMSLVVNR